MVRKTLKTGIQYSVSKAETTPQKKIVLLLLVGSYRESHPTANMNYAATA